MKFLKNIIISTFLLSALGCEKHLDSENAGVDLSSDTSCSKSYALIRTTKGNIQFCFYSKAAPELTNRMIGLINEGVYNNTKFHRVVSGELVQTGDLKNYRGDRMMITKNDIPLQKGSVVMAYDSINHSYNTQFYFALSSLPNAQNPGSVFGRVTNGNNVLDDIAEGDSIISAVIINPEN